MTALIQPVIQPETPMLLSVGGLFLFCLLLIKRLPEVQQLLLTFAQNCLRDSF